MVAGERGWARAETEAGDVAMHRVKFNVNTEYGYIQNMKVLQSKASRRVCGAWV